MFCMIPTVYAEVYINEIMYNPLGSDSEFEYLELYGNDILDNYTFEGIAFSFPENSTINGYLIIAKSGFVERYGIEPNYTFTGSLTNNGEIIKLINNITIDEVSYTNIASEGYSLEFNGSDFLVSLVENGTPFGLNSVLNLSYVITNTTVNNTTLNSSNTTTNITLNLTNSSINQTNTTTNIASNLSNTTTNSAPIIEVATTQPETTEKLPIIQSFFTRVRKFEENKEIKFFSTIHNKAKSQKILEVTFNHNDNLQSRTLTLAPEGKEQLTFITNLFAGLNDFSLTLFLDGEAIDRRTDRREATAILVEVEDKNSPTKTSKTSEKSPNNNEISKKTVTEDLKSEKPDNEPVKPLESFKKQSPLQIPTGSAVYEGKPVKNNKIIGFILLGVSIIFNIILIWKR